MNKDIGIKIDPPMLDDFLQADHASAMRRVCHRPAEDLARCVDLYRRNEWLREFPPGARRFIFIIEVHCFGLDVPDCGCNSDIMDEAPRLTAEVGRHPKAIMQ